MKIITILVIIQAVFTYSIEPYKLSIDKMHPYLCEDEKNYDIKFNRYNYHLEAHFFNSNSPQSVEVTKIKSLYENYINIFF